MACLYKFPTPLPLIFIEMFAYCCKLNFEVLCASQRFSFLCIVLSRLRCITPVLMYLIGLQVKCVHNEELGPGVFDREVDLLVRLGDQPGDAVRFCTAR